MKSNKLDARLKDIASLVDKCQTIADIGTDHGYLAIHLIESNICKKAYATDIAKGPLDRAVNNIKENHLEDKIETILTNGLINVPKVNYVVIAGMGANLICDILSNNRVRHDCYVLEANQNVDILREYLSKNGYVIIDEKISYVNKKYYEIIKAVNGKCKLSKQEITFGPINLIKKEDLFINKWEMILNNYLSILTNFNGNDKEKAKLLKKVKEIKSILGK